MTELERDGLRCGPPAGAGFPLVVQPQGKIGAGDAAGLAGWIRRDRPWLDEQLLAHGAILLRGFAALRTVDDFETVARAVSSEMMDYVGGASPRSPVKDKIATSTDAPPFFPISPHQELSYTSEVPDWLLFFCEVAPRTGGQTPLVDMRAVDRKLSSDVKARFEQRGVRLHRHLPRSSRRIGPRSWPAVFNTENRKEVERITARRNWALTWLKNGDLRMSYDVVPPRRRHPVTGETVWFNQANLMHPSALPSDAWNEGKFALWFLSALARRVKPSLFHCELTHADGGRILESDLDHIRAVMREETVVFDWRQGDLLWLDNYLVAHGRRSFKGPRRILAALLRDPARQP